MPRTDYIRVKIGDFEIVTEDPSELPVSINYALENEKNFQTKESGTAFDVETPAVLANSKGANTSHNPSVEDMTEGKIMRDYQPALIEASGYELLKGRAIMTNGRHTDVPKSYKWDLYGDNADWMIELADVTMYDILKHISFTFSKDHIIESWMFDGRSEALPYVFAPVRYRDSFGGKKIDDQQKEVIIDDNVTADYLRPSLSKYWIMYWGFKIAGYKLQSEFMNLDYYRRMVMPWTWGNFLSSEGTKLDVLRFLAKSVGRAYYDSPNGGHDEIWDLNVVNDSIEGAYDNNGDPGNYTYDHVDKAMVWTYNPPHHGVLEAHFSLMIDYQMQCTGNSSANLYVQWFKNGVRIDGLNGDPGPKGNLIGHHESSGLGGTLYDMREMFCKVIVAPGDVVSAKIHRHTFESKIGTCNVSAEIIEYKLSHFRIPIGGLINFENYTGLKKWKFLDFLKGECDLYNCSFNTDNFKKVVCIEPTHDYEINGIRHKGYFSGETTDWNDKKDYSKEWDLNSISEGDRERSFKLKDDHNDGLLKKINDRHVINLASAKYVLPSRFKSSSSSTPVENRFFAPTMHFEANQFKSIGTGVNQDVAPQFICIVPENIANTSNSEAANTFNPKSAYYKGLILGVGAWRFDGEVLQQMPYMFAVNYKPGGENDPVLSYSDERIGVEPSYTIGVGLLRKFYLQRMANLRNGQQYDPAYFKLNNTDVSGMHRDYKIVNGQKWELIKISNYQPLKDESTSAILRKTVPIIKTDIENIYPSQISVLEDNPVLNVMDLKYQQSLCLTSDIPQ